MTHKQSIGTALVTGVAGFVGSHLAERLLEDGWTVKGVDCFTEAYARSIKEQNLARAKEYSRFSLVEVDLATGDLPEVVVGVANGKTGFNGILRDQINQIAFSTSLGCTAIYM